MKLLLDTNVLLLLLLLAGSVLPGHIANKRLRQFIWEDYLLIANWAAEIPRHLSIPNILTEVSNFVGDEKQELFQGARAALKAYVSGLEEIYVPSQKVVETENYLRLGLTDAAIYERSDEQICVVSTDYNLCNRLNEKGVDVRNPFNFR